jgi:uncharacterized OB-fold protein
MSEAIYPQPRETPTNAPMLAAWREEAALALQCCEACGATFFYPRPMCPRCWSPDVTWRRASGAGRVVSFSRIHRGLPRAFRAEAPIVLAEIELPDAEGGARMIARVVTEAPDEIRSGMAVRLVPLPAAARYPLPTFQPA